MTQATPHHKRPLRSIQNVTCTECGCLCDDIELIVDVSRIIRAENACEMGSQWFLQPFGNQPVHPAHFRGHPADLETSVNEAALILHNAKFPLVFGLSECPCETQRMAVSLADRIGACLDTTTSIHHGPSGVSFPDIGEVTCSLGEVKNRADLVVFWGVDPTETHPRHGERYSLEVKGLFTPNGRKDRFAVLVDSKPSRSPDTFDRYLPIRPGSDFEALWTLRSLIKNVPVSPEIEKVTGISLALWTDLAKRMKSCRFGVIFIGMGLSRSVGRHMNNEAALGLVTDLNDHTRFFAKTMKGKGNGTGADNVLLWQTGYPFAVHLGQGYPRYNPGEFSAVESLIRGEPDAAIMIGADPMADFPEEARQHLDKIPVIAIDCRQTETMRRATVSFATATYGIQTGGTVYRMDDVSLPLRPPLSSPNPSDSEILSRLERRIHHLQSVEGQRMKHQMVKNQEHGLL